MLNTNQGKHYYILYLDKQVLFLWFHVLMESKHKYRHMPTCWCEGLNPVIIQYNMHFTRVVKLFFVASLFLIFLFLFGKPSLEKYFKKNTIFVESKVKFDYTNPPAITFLSTKTKLYFDLEECRSKQNYQSVVDCYNQHFLNKTQLLQPPTLHNFSWAQNIPFGDLCCYNRIYYMT